MTILFELIACQPMCLFVFWMTTIVHLAIFDQESPRPDEENREFSKIGIELQLTFWGHTRSGLQDRQHEHHTITP